MIPNPQQAIRHTAYAMFDVLLANRGSGPMRSAIVKEAIDQLGWSGSRTYRYASQAQLGPARKYLRDSGVPLVVTRNGADSTYAIEEVTAGGHVYNFERYERDLYSSAASFYRSLSGAHGQGRRLLRDRIYQACLAIGLDLGMSQESVDRDLKRSITDQKLIDILDHHNTGP